MKEKAVKNILFTFDYELFLGKKSGSVYKCVIEPTRKVLNVFYDFNMSAAIFFVDTLWLLKLKSVVRDNSLARKDYDMVVEQLRQIHRIGHYVFPHLHPHWMDATYLREQNQWQMLNYSRYRIHNLDKAEREKCFDDSVALLKEILGNEYLPLGYRAGGWSIQPFEDFLPLFQKHKVLHDFSVLPETKHISSGQHYDFSDVKISIPYRFSTDVAVPGNGVFTEYPISMIDIPALRTFANKAYLKYLWWNGIRSHGDGQGVVTESSVSNTSAEMAAIELMNDVKLSLYLKYLKSNDYMQLIAHPKMLSQHNIDVFRAFVKKAMRTYKVNTDFIKLQPKK